MGWGGGHNGELAAGVLVQIVESNEAESDEWKVIIKSGKEKKSKKNLLSCMKIGTNVEAALWCMHFGKHHSNNHGDQEILCGGHSTSLWFPICSSLAVWVQHALCFIRQDTCNH